MTLLTHLKAYRETLTADLSMQGVTSLQARHILLRPEIALVVRLRQAELLRRMADEWPWLRPVYWLVRLRYAIVCNKYASTLPLNVFGPGLSIAHIGSLTVNSQAVVGQNCRVHPGVVIGAVGERAPRIGDDVFIGPNAVVVGDIEVGSRVHIGPGAVVSKSVPSDTVVTVQPHRIQDRTRATWQETWRRRVFGGNNED